MTLSIGDLDPVSTITSIVSAATALVAVLISPLVSIWIAKKQNLYGEQQLQAQLEIAKNQIASQLAINQKQIAASVLSRNRQAWINDLRNYIAEYITTITAMVAPAVTNEKVWIPQIERIMLIMSKIDLMLNPDEDDHKKLMKLLRDGLTEIASAFQNNQIQNNQRGALINKISKDVIPLSQKILKREWNRVKTLE